MSIEQAFPWEDRELLLLALDYQRDIAMKGAIAVSSEAWQEIDLLLDRLNALGSAAVEGA
jgi:hypothetical protein